MIINFRLWLETSLPKVNAYWISPSGTPMASVGLHITDILNAPDKFGFTPDQITELHAKYGEQLGQEGKAREELILNAMKRGWMRLRRRNRPDYWIIQYIPNSTSNRRISNWILDMVGLNYMHSNEEIRLVPVDGSPTKRMSARDYLRALAA